MSTPAPQPDWNNTPWESVRDGVERKLCLGDKVTVAQHRVWARAVNNRHSHPEEQVVYLLSGRLSYEIGGQIYTLQAGDVVIVPSNVPHQSKALGDEPAVTMDIFSPARKY